MKFLKNKINKINKLYHKKFFLIKSKKISSLLKKLSKAEKIQIYDIGAGLRYLPTLLKFDGISRIHLIDPSQNLQRAYRNLKKLFSDKNSNQQLRFITLIDIFYDYKSILLSI